MPRMKRNFVVKTIDGKVGGVQKALKAAGIDVLSVIEVYKEELPDEGAAPESGAAGAAESTENAAPVKASASTQTASGGGEAGDIRSSPPSVARGTGETPPAAKI